VKLVHQHGLALFFALHIATCNINDVKEKQNTVKKYDSLNYMIITLQFLLLKVEMTFFYCFSYVQGAVQTVQRALNDSRR